MSVTGLTAAFITHEIRTQWRSLRFRVLAAAYVLGGGFPAVLLYARHHSAKLTVGGATYAAEVFFLLPVFTAVVSLLISVDAVTREQDEGSWSTASLAGMSSAGYLLRRWLALQAVLLPLTAAPVAIAGIAATAALRPGAVTWGPLLGPWLMHVVPIALAHSALGLGLGTIAGGMINAVLLGGLVLWLVPTLINSVLAHFGIHFWGGWLETGWFSLAVRRITTPYSAADPWPVFPQEMSESPWDWRVAAEQYLALAALPMALSVATLGFAVRHLRRTRPDVRPLRIGPGHPLRNFLLIVARLRERYTADPRPSRSDLLAIGAALLLALGALALLVERAEHYQRLGEVRFAMEASGKPDPTPNDVVPGRWRVEGTLGPDRGVDLTVTAEMLNHGAVPRGHLAFTLNSHVRVETATAKEGTLRVSRHWDRLSVDVSPPIPPGGAREMRFRLRGEPAEDRLFAGYDAAYWGFYKTFGDHLHARFGRDLADLSKAYQVPALSPRRIDLQAADLTPVPRYQTWKLYADEEMPHLLRMPEEVFFPLAEVSLDLAAPTGFLVADPCGGLVSPQRPGRPGPSGHLMSHCRLAVSDLTVAGGHYLELPRPGGTGATVAVLPFHAALGELHLGFLANGTSRLDEAWPGLGDLRQTVVLEWPSGDAFGLDAGIAAYSNRWADPGRAHIWVQGELVRMTEMDLIRTDVVKPDTLVAELVAGRLARRRPATPDDAQLIRMLLRSLVLQRLGILPEGGAAVVGVRTGMEVMLSIPPPESSYSLSYWNNRFPALVTALRYRMGEEALRGAVEDVLSRTDAKPLTRQELYAAIEKRSEVPVHRMIEDFFVEGYLPQPILDGVEFHHAGDGWRVTGRMRNRTKGEALCKIVLSTDLGRLETTARADGDQPGDFSFSTPRRPQAVMLDPDRECHRLIPLAGARDRVFFDGNAP